MPVMTATIAAIAVIGFLFTLGCGCGCCHCTSCSQADDEAATYEVAITGVIDSACCTGCSAANGTYSVTYQEFSASACNDSGTIDVVGCCWFVEIGDGATPIIDCSACSAPFPSTYLRFWLGISSAEVHTGSPDCSKTITQVGVVSDFTPGMTNEMTDIAHFEDLSSDILDCSLASYNARDIPFVGALSGAGCDWWTTPATCTVTRT